MLIPLSHSRPTDAYQDKNTATPCLLALYWGTCCARTMRWEELLLFGSAVKVSQFLSLGAGGGGGGRAEVRNLPSESVSRRYSKKPLRSYLPMILPQYMFYV